MVINFIAALEEKSLDEIDTIASQLEQKGCKIKHVLRFSGIIAGSIEKNVPLHQLKVPGIKHIEKDREIRANEGD